jgi:hypothetical protein
VADALDDHTDFSLSTGWTRGTSTAFYLGTYTQTTVTGATWSRTGAQLDRVEDRIRHAKDSGLGRLPSREFAINTAWCTAVAIAADPIAWLRLLALDGDLAVAEPKALR